MPTNSTTRIITVVQVTGEESYAFSAEDTLAVASAIPSAGMAVLLPAAPSSGDAYEIADGDGSCSSGSPLTLTAGAGQTIQGASSLALTTPFAWARATFAAGLRSWIVFVAGAGSTFARKPLPYTTIYVDPQDESGHASNDNPGTSPSAPIATTVHLNAINFFGNLTANTLIEYLSDDLSGVGVQLSTLDLSSFTLTVRQTRQVLHTGGTLDAGTIAIDPAGNQAQVVHTSDLSSFAPYVVTQLGGAATFAVRIEDTTSTAGAWIVSDATAAAPQCTRAVNPDGTAGVLTSGDGYTLSRGGQLTLSAQPAPLFRGDASLVFEDCAFTAFSAGCYGISADAVRCSFLGAVPFGFAMSDCFVQAGLNEVVAGAMSMLAGAMVTTGDDTWTGSLSLGGDVYITGHGLEIGGDFFDEVFFVPPSLALGAGVQFQDNADNGVVIYTASSLVISTGSQALLWGTGNLAHGLLVFGAQAASVSAATPPIVTGALGDFAFIGPAEVGYVTVARAAVLGAYSEAGSAATRTTTWAHFAASVVSGGFDFGAFCVESGAALVGV
jgi:hypothetical protein